MLLFSMKLPSPSEIRKPTKTISGITPVAVMLPPKSCEHGNCIYCPSMNVPQSYTPKSPVVLRAQGVNYDSYKQVRGRLKAFKVMNHPTDKIEIIIMGGTFLEYDKKFQYEFVKGLYDGLNGKRSRTLKLAQKLNEKSKHRCVALCVETRPDVCIEFIDRLREWGVTRVELGVQIIDDKIYEKIKRGHKVSNVINATRELKNAGFKIGYHIMPGLPFSNFRKDVKLFKKLFSSSDFRPDQLKLYPCQVMPCSELEKIYWNKKFVPYSKKETEKVLIAMLKLVPRYCRVMRVMREIPPEYIVAGVVNIDLRKDIEEELRKKNSKLKEIRYREIGFMLRDKREINFDLKLKITKYKASKGDEYFLEIVNKDDVLFGLCRLRVFEEKKIPAYLNSQISSSVPEQVQGTSGKTIVNKKIILTNKNVKLLDKVSCGTNTTFECNKNKNKKKAIIRELHVYGPALKLGEKGKFSQHTGLGKWLMNEAEKIALKNKIKKLSVISGIGVREYYKKLGYKLEGSYMVKFL